MLQNWNGRYSERQQWKSSESLGMERGEPCVEEKAAIRTALSKAQEAGLRRVEVQSDCQAAVNRINNGTMDDASTATFLEDTQQLRGMFQHC